MKPAFIACAIFLSAGAAKAWEWEPPQTHDYVELGAALGLAGLDTWQSMSSISTWQWRVEVGADGRFHTVKHYDKMEIGPPRLLFGANPTKPQFLICFGAGAAVVTGAWLVLPERARWIAPLVGGSIEATMVARNFSIGMTVKL